MGDKFLAACSVLLLLSPAILFGLLGFPYRAALLVYFFIAVCYVFSRRVLKERESRRRFEGQVAGVCAALYLSGVCCESTAEEIYRYSMEELARCRSRDVPADGRILYASRGDFGKFALLCAIRYAEGPGRDYRDAPAILAYCHEHIREAELLTAHGLHPWSGRA